MGLCDGCVSSKAFGKKCWFFWDGKRQCSQFRRNADSQPELREEENFVVPKF